MLLNLREIVYMREHSKTFPSISILFSNLNGFWLISLLLQIFNFLELTKINIVEVFVLNQ